MKTNIIHLQDCVEGMLALPEKSVDIVTTSPPYNLDIAYSTYKDNTPRQEYLNWLDEVFAAVKYCLKDNGHFWLNVGYSNIDPWVGMDVANVARQHFVLQNNFIWVKSIAIDDITSGHFKPINSNRFANATWEHLFHFTKTGDITCDKLGVGVPYMNNDTSSRNKGLLAKKYGFANIKDFNKNASADAKAKMEVDLAEKLVNKIMKQNNRFGHCRGNTWFVSYDSVMNSTSCRGTHPATYPVVLIEQCIKFSGLTSGILIDPFMGSGTSAIAAINCHMDYIGFDIDAEYKQFAEDRIFNRQNK